MREKLAHIVIVTFNRLVYTKAVVESLLSVDSGYPFKITFVDNASEDGTQDFLNNLKHESILYKVLLNENVGVSRGSNIGWYLGPKDYYIKLDNDMVVQKEGWLFDLVNAADNVFEGGVFGFNVEQQSYPLESINGIKVRIKKRGNLGGACFMVPRRTFNRFGYWYEFGPRLYGEEDAEYSFRISHSNLKNIYMEDEKAFVHLPGGRADMPGEETKYRKFKDFERKRNLVMDSIFQMRMSEVARKENMKFVPEWIDL